MGLTEFRTPEQEFQRFRRRLAIAFALVVAAFLLLIGRLVYLQVIRHEHYQTLAEDNRISILAVAPNRGTIYDRNGIILAQNYSAYTLEVTPSKIVGDLETTIDQLAEIVDLQPHHRKRFKKLLEESRNFDSLPLKTRLSDEEVARFAANRYRFPGVEINARLFRHYPLGEVASHVIGYIGRINQKDVERIEAEGLTAEYKGTNYIGKVGLELSYEKDLHGTTGVEEVEVDSRGRAVRVLSRKPPIPGNNLRLSIDIQLQQAAETAFGDRRGALVAIEPATGDVLAFVSRPGYDPNLFVEGIDPTNWDMLNNSPWKPLLNRPLRGAYPPGSTFKPFLALFALETGKRTPGQTISDPGHFTLGGHTWNDDKKGGHGVVDMYTSIVVSCDTYYYKLGAESEIDDIATFLKPFGFGQKTGIDIEGELTGVLPSRDWKRNRFKRDQKWHSGDSVSAGIGQGYNTYTPMQLAYATAVLANNGVAFKPHLVKQIENVGTGEITKIAPKPLYTIPLKQGNIDIIKNAMVGVAKAGTSARVFAGSQYVSAGKTGTAQVFNLKGQRYQAHKIEERLRDHAWYIAYAPADNPTIALVVLAENGGFGAQAAAPIARAVFDYYLLGKSVKPVPPAQPDPKEEAEHNEPDPKVRPELDGDSNP